MPRLSQWAIRAALCYLMAGFTIGALVLIQKGVPFNPLVWRLIPAHIEFLLLGWCAQLALSVAYWILPRFRDGSSRGTTRLAALAVVLLNIGVWLVAVAPLVDVPFNLQLAGRILELCAATAFMWHAFPRVRALR